MASLSRIDIFEFCKHIDVVIFDFHHFHIVFDRCLSFVSAEPNIYVVNSNTDQPLSSVTTTTTSVLPDVTNSVDLSSKPFDLWKMDTLMESGYINTYFRGNHTGGSTNYPSLQAFPPSASHGGGSNLGPMSLLSLNISHNPKPMQGTTTAAMTSSHSQTNLSALTSSQLPLQVFR